MALIPENEAHGLQIEAGTIGRKKGHAFEKQLTDMINNFDLRLLPKHKLSHLEVGNPAALLLGYVQQHLGLAITGVRAWWIGGLATARDGDALLDNAGKPISKCKSDVWLEVATAEGARRIGVSVKTCNKKTPTNAQMYFTTARAFCQLLISNDIHCSDDAVAALSMFCGDVGYRPMDIMDEAELQKRVSDPNRYYWEGLPQLAQEEWQQIFSEYQDKITLLLFQKAYKDDPFPPSLLLHQTRKYDSIEDCSLALFTMDEVVMQSGRYSGFILSPYVIRKGTYKGDPATHYAPDSGLFSSNGEDKNSTQPSYSLT